MHRRSNFGNRAWERVSYIALPEFNDLPTFRSERRSLPGIPALVQCKLPAPEVPMRLGQRQPMLRAPVPEVTVDHHGDPRRGERDVRAPGGSGEIRPEPTKARVPEGFP